MHLQRTLPSRRAWFGAVAPADVQFVVITDGAYHATRVPDLLNGWMRWLPNRTQVAIVSNVDDPAIPTVFSPNSCCGYDPAQRKWLNAVRHVRDAAPAHVKWVWVLDDDAFLVVPAALRLLSTLDPDTPAYYGELCPPHKSFAGICGGASWVAPRFVVDNVANYLETLPWPPSWDETVSDRILSLAFSKINVPFYNSPQFCSQPPEFYPTNPIGIAARPGGLRDTVSYHYIRDGAARAMYYALAGAYGPDADAVADYVAAGAPPGV